jgi:hypothetical protein
MYFQVELPKSTEVDCIERLDLPMPHFLEYLLPALNKYSSRTLLKMFTGTPKAPSWESVTYQTFIDDLERVAAYWIEPLKKAGLQSQDVIGLWYASRS